MVCIYKTTNKINQKIYIGKTNNLKRRIDEHKRRNKSIFDRALEKYGSENFEWEILEFVEKEKSNEREKYWIKKFNSYFRDINSNGYNMTRGGDGGSAWNLKQVHIYDINGNYIKTFESFNSLRKKLNFKGTFKQNRLIQNKYIVQKGEKHKKIEPYKRKTRAKEILQIDKDEKIIKNFYSIKEAEKNGYNRTGIIGCLKGYYKTSKGYYWCYKEKYCEFKIKNENKEIKSYKNDRIVKLSLNMDILNYYSNCSEAARKNNIKSNKTIHKSLKTKTHYSHGYLWFKESDLVNMLIPR